MILDAAPALPCATGFDLAGCDIVADRTGGDGRHLVVRTAGAFHRLWLRGTCLGGPVVAAVPLDALVEARLPALSDLYRSAAGQDAGDVSAARPTRYQAHRLALLLAILDLRAGDPVVTSHEIARRLVYPRLSIGRGATWKSSPERRRTQRLIREAEALAAGGYRALLAGRPGRQK